MRSRAWTIVAVAACSIASILPARAADPWQDVPAPPGASARADGGRWLRLDDAAISARLAPLRDGETTTLGLPLPDGERIAFDVQPAEAMAPALATAHLAIRAWRGAASDGGLARLRMESTPSGIDAMIYLPDRVVLLQPDRGSGLHRSIVRARGPHHAAPVCGVDDALQAQRDARHRHADARSSATPASVGPNLRTYRVAIASTAEFTAANGGASATLALIVGAVNRINQIYENDLGVRLQLVAGNEELVFTDTATDGYSDQGLGGDNFALMQQNQARVDAIIGTANYDIAHVFSSTGGGVAQVGVTCLANFKAQGVSGTSLVPGDPFFVDVVAHELGHQLDATHTFNSAVDRCGPNRVAMSAFEAGSGSTIMAYPGVCFDAVYEENVQFVAQPNFHVHSLQQIHAYTESAAGSCGTLAATGNSTPVVAAVANVTIPSLTPFALTASASDVDDDELTYSWEQYDLGTASPPLSDDGSRPLLRAHPPSASPTRVFPRLEDILAGRGGPFDFGVGEVLPTSSRALTFRAVVRDNHPGAGGVQWSGSPHSVATATTVTVVESGVGFGLTGFNTPETIQPGVPQVINWTVAGSHMPPVSCPAVEIAWSRDNGSSFPLVLAADTPNDGSETLAIPPPSTAQGRLRIRCLSNVFFDINNAPIRLQGDAVPPRVASIIRLDPSPTAISPVRFQLRFSEDVTGLDPTDLVAVATGTMQGEIVSIEGSGQVYTVRVSIGGASGGLLTLDVVDDDTIRDNSGNPLGGNGGGNGGYGAGESYTIPADTFIHILRDGFERR